MIDGVSTEIINAYFRYLCSLVGADTRMQGQYWRLLKQLHSIEFYWTIRNDDNRAGDGENLRVQFFYNLHENSDDFEEFLYSPCSVLEMLVALSQRIDRDLMSGFGVNDVDRTAVWFWMMIENLGLIDCKDDIYGEQVRAKVQHYVENFMDRSYQKDGSGGLFPLRNPQKDQRKVEIWYQMQAYMQENF